MLLNDIEKYLSNDEINSDVLFKYMNELSALNKSEKIEITSKLFLKLTLFALSEDELKALKRNKPFSRIITLKEAKLKQHKTTSKSPALKPKVSKQSKKYKANQTNKPFELTFKSYLNKPTYQKSKTNYLSSFEGYYSEFINFLKNKKMVAISSILEYDVQDFQKICEQHNLYVTTNERFDLSKLMKIEPIIKAYSTNQYADFKVRNHIKHPKKRYNIKPLSEKDKIRLENDQYRNSKSVIIVPKGYYQ